MKGRALRAALAAAALALAAVAGAQDAPSPAPRIVEIFFVGNKHTEPSTMLREMTVHVGDPAEPAAVERSRQAIQDLGLFRSVAIDPMAAEGGVRLRVTVDEKYYLIPAPRADANSDKKYAYGVQLRWYNVLGLNHTMKFTWKKINRQEAGRGTGSQVDTSYYAPFVFDTPYGLDVSYSHLNEPVDVPPPSPDPASPYSAFDDITQNSRVVVSRSFHGDKPASQGWRLGAGVAWQGERYIGTATPRSPGQATGLVFDAFYNDVRYNIFSDAGLRGAFEIVSSTKKVASDYSYTIVTAGYNQAWYVGQRAHQSLAVFAEGGLYHGGPPGAIASAFELGGAEDLRGYQHSLLHGNTYYYTGVEFLRPLFIDAVRGVVFLESGNVSNEVGDFAFGGSYNDIGLGLRIRLSKFVKFEVNLGVAYPLTHRTSGPRFFGTGRRGTT